MKYFQTLQNNMAKIGLIRNNQQNRGQYWDFRRIICTTIYTVDAMTMVAYVVYEADNLEQYMESIFSLISVAGVEVAYISFFFKNDKILNLFELVSKEYTKSK